MPPGGAGRRGRGLLSGLRLQGGLCGTRLRQEAAEQRHLEHCMMHGGQGRRILDAPPRYLVQVKTDCLLTQRLPKRFAERLRALEALRHPDGTRSARGRDEAVAGQQ